MKHLFSILLITILPLVSIAQTNLVPNPSFEQYINCPNGGGQVTTHCQNWRDYTNATPDYFNSCNTALMSVPMNFGGIQPAAEGSAYCGLISHLGSNHFEYIATNITPLQPGATYEVSMSVNRSDNSACASNNLGIYFYDDGSATFNTNQLLGFTPQIHYANYGIIYDTANWVRLTKTFVADSAYDNIVIGGFNNGSSGYSVDTTKIGPYYSYYYIDSVVIIKLDTFKVNILDSILCAGDTVTAVYHVPENKNANNIFTVQISNASGNFDTPLNIGTNNSDTSGSILCTIPVDIVNGNAYRIRVIASNNADTSYINTTNIRIANPDSTILSTTVNSPVCERTILNFNANSSVTSTTYQWVGPNGFNTTMQNPSLGIAQGYHAGDYYITYNIFGCVVKDTVTVVVKSLPNKPVAANNTPLCAGATVNLTGSSSSNVTYSWTGPGSFSSSTQNPSFSNSTTSLSGDYILIATMNGCSSKDTTTVLVKPLPTPVTVGNNGPVCVVDTLRLASSASSAGATYTWTGPNSFGANTQNTSINNPVVANTGWYKMLVDLNGCTYQDSTYATVYPQPAMPPISINYPLCMGDTLNLSTPTIAGATYTWSGPGSFGANTQNASRTGLSFSDTGTYRLVATVAGCTSPQATASVNINPNPFVVIIANPGDTICVGNSVQFTGLPNYHGGSPTYLWSVNGQPVGTGNTYSTTQLNDGDIVYCEMTEYTKCHAPYTDPSNDIKVAVLPWLPASVSITASTTTPIKQNEYITFTAKPVGGGTKPDYQWKLNNNDVLGAKAATWSANTLNNNDQVCVEMMSNYRCPSPAAAKSNCIDVKVITTGINDIGDIKGLVLYPNPNNGKFILEGTVSNNETLKIEIVNTTGQVIYSRELLPENGIIHTILNPSNLSAGLYLLRVSSGTSHDIIRFTVQ